MSKKLLGILLVGVLCWSCERNHQSDYITASTIIMNDNSHTNVIIHISTEKNDSIDDTEILVFGTIINEETSTPISNAKVRIAGSDTPGNTSYSDVEGHCSVLLPIVPDRNAESIMLVVEVQHPNAITQPLTKFSEDKLVYQLLGVTDPANYMVAYVGTINVGWNRLGNTLKCTIPLKIK